MAAVVCDLGPAEVDIVGVRGGDKNELILNLKQAGVPLDISDMTLTAQARKKSTDLGPPAITALVNVLDGPTGRVSVRWPGVQVTEVLAGKSTWNGVWDLQQIEDGNEPITLVAGSFKAQQDVTR